jgi:DNA-binding XRE family transcriptional regulator
MFVFATIQCKVHHMENADEEALYRAVGERIRTARERQPVRLSQDALAKKLEISRASIVNIEAGRQHAPLYLLWKIAKHLDVELLSLIPSAADLAIAPSATILDDGMREELKKYTNGDVATEIALSSFIAQAVEQLSGSRAPMQRPNRRRT